MGIEAILGELPQGWETTTLGEICQRGGGSIQTGPFGSQLHASDYVEVGIPSIMPQNIGDNHVNPDGIARITEKDAKRLERYLVRKGDIVYSRRGDVERRALITEKEDGWLCGTGSLRVRLGSFDHVDPIYASYYLGDLAVREWIVRHAVGATMPNLNTAILSALPFVLPLLPEQRAIAGILGAFDDKIEVNRRMNVTLESMARAVFRQWFVDSEESSKWEEKSLDEVANFLNGLALQKFPANEGDDYLPVIKISQLRTNNTKDADKASTNIPHQYIIEDGDILFSWSGSLVVVAWCGGKGALNQHLFKVTSEKYPKWFYYYWTKHHLADFQEIAAGKATTMGHIQRHHLKAAKILVPSDKELKEMDKVMSPLLDKIIINNLESRTLASLRDSLLPKLMRGEVRL